MFPTVPINTEMRLFIILFILHDFSLITSYFTVHIYDYYKGLLLL